MRLGRELSRLLENPGHGEVLKAPIGVEFPVTGEGVQPDLLFVSEERKGIVAPEWLKGAPEEAPRHERFTDRLPVRLRGDVVGEIDLEEVFCRG